MQALEMEVEDPEEYSYEYEETDGFLRSSDPSPSNSLMVDFQKTFKDVTAFFKKHRRISTLMLLAVFVSVFLFQADGAVTTEFEKVDYTVEKVHGANGHGNSFGGINNIAHPGGAKAAANNEGVAFADIIIPESNVGHAVKSLNEANIKNLWGHYVHDEHRSPYASFRYASKTQEELEEEQQSYVRKMKRVREEWGAWDFADPNPDLRAKTKNQADFTKTPYKYKDLPVSEFPSKSWQADKEYLELFLKEGRALVTRMQKGIYAEYGWPLKDGMSTEELEKHEGLWKIHVLEDNEDPNSFTTGIAKLSKVAMDGLVRKLLHAMTTHDDFYAVLAGHSAAAGHGNNFQQNRIITFHKIMEPVFDKLGMRLVSRNMGMGGVGTLQFSMAGGDLYGEADILEWDSGMTEKGPAVDLFNKQAILSGERVPLIMSDYHFDIMTETNGTAYFGKYINDNSIFPLTDYSNVDTIPYAAQWFNEKEDKYNAVCWEPRNDFTPTVQQKQHPRSQVGWHPGNRRHLWSGRKLALIVLHALSLAFDTWETGLEKDGYPLAEQYWHVQKKYDTIRQNLRTHITTPKEGKEDIRSYCENMISWLPRICRVQLHGFGMWNPRAHDDFDFLNLIHEAPNGYKPYYKTEPVYSGFDLLPYVQKLADDQVDVHAIAIATTSPPPPLNHSYSDDDDHNGETEETPPTRRWLRLNSDKAIRHADRSRSRKSRSIVTPRKFSRRKLVETNADNEIIAGRGWEVHGWHTLKQFADGSAQSEAGRSPQNDCLLYGANDVHMAVIGDSLSGWLIFTVPKVREGIILIRMEWWCEAYKISGKITEKWTEVNDGKTHDTTPYKRPDDNDRKLLVSSLDDVHRALGKPTFESTVPVDIEMDIAIDGKIVRTLNYEDFKQYMREYIKNVALWPILDDIDMAEKDWEGEAKEVGIRYRSQLKPDLGFCISHVYFA